MSLSTAVLVLTMTVNLFCPTVGQTAFTVSVTQDVYQAEEHGNITLTWLFPVKTDMSSATLHIRIYSVEPMRTIYLYNFNKFEAQTYQDEHYRGRMQCDPELAKRGRIECIFTDLRLSDTGTYKCIVIVNQDTNHMGCNVNVTAASNRTMNEPSKPASRGRIGLYLGLCTVLSAALSVFIGLLITCLNTSYGREHSEVICSTSTC